LPAGSAGTAHRRRMMWCDHTVLDRDAVLQDTKSHGSRPPRPPPIADGGQRVASFWHLSHPHVSGQAAHHGSDLDDALFGRPRAGVALDKRIGKRRCSWRSRSVGYSVAGRMRIAGQSLPVSAATEAPQGCEHRTPPGSCVVDPCQCPTNRVHRGSRGVWNQRLQFFTVVGAVRDK